MAQLEPHQIIRTIDYPNCPVCGTRGEPLYQALVDHLFDAPGTWNLKQCPDKTCGLIWLDPKPIEEDMIKAYETYYTHEGNEHQASNSWLRRAIVFIKQGYIARKYKYNIEGVGRLQRYVSILAHLHPARRAWLDFNVMYLPAHSGGRLLEVGFGSGKSLKRMAELGWEVEGVDFDPIAVENARQKGLTVQLGTLEDQNYATDSFDAITMSHLIEHVDNPVQLLSECYRILRPGGCLVIVTPNNESLGHTVFKEAWLGLDPPRHIHIFNSHSLDRILTQSGFGDITTWTTIRYADGVFRSSVTHTFGETNNSKLRSLSLTIPSKVFQIAEWLVMKLQPHRGEDIFAIARK